MKTIIAKTSNNIFSHPALAVLTAMCMLWFSAITLEAVPGIINYQGKISEDGIIFESLGEFKFALVNAGGTVSHWSNDGTSVAGSEPAAFVTLEVTRGNFSVGLGGISLAGMTDPITPGIFSANDDIFLRVWFRPATDPGAFQLLSPDLRITSEGFAFAAAHASEAGTLNGLDSNDFLLKNDHDTSPADGIIDTVEFAFVAANATDAGFASEAGHAITADFAVTASEAGTLNGMDSSEFLIRADEDVSPDNGIIDHADFASNANFADAAGDANTLGGLSSADFALDMHPHAGEDITSGKVADTFLTDNVALQDTANVFTATNTFSSDEMFVGGNNDFSFSMPPNSAMARGTSLALVGQDADPQGLGEGTGDLDGGSIDLFPGNGINNGVRGSINLFGNTSVFGGDLSVEGVILGNLTGTADNATEADMLDGFDGADFILRNDVDATPADGIIDEADFANFAAIAGDADLLQGLGSAEFVLRNEVDATPADGVIDIADFANFADEANFLGGNEASDFLDKATYDNDGNGEVDDSSLSGNVALLDNTNTFSAFNTFSSSSAFEGSTITVGKDPAFLLQRPMSTSGDGTSLFINGQDGLFVPPGLSIPFNGGDIILQPGAGNLDGVPGIVSVLGDLGVDGNIIGSLTGTADSATSADDSDLLDGLDSTEFASDSHTHSAGDADTLDSFDSTDFILRNDVDATPANGNVDLADVAILADFATTASEAGTLDGFDSTDFILRNDVDATPNNGIIDLAQDADTLDGLDSTAFAQLSTMNNFSAENTFSATSMTVGGDNDFTIGMPVNTTVAEGTTFTIQGQDAGSGTGALKGGDINLSPGAGTTGGVSGSINLNGDTNVTGMLTVTDGMELLRTILVSPDDGGGTTDNGDILVSAISAVSAAASSATPYLIKIEPGTYDLGGTTLVVPDYVDIEGSGKGITTIKCVSGSGPVIQMKNLDHGALRHLSVEHTGGNIAIEIENSYASLFEVNASSTNGSTANNIAIKIHNGSTSITASLCKVSAYAYGTSPIGIEFDGHPGEILDSDVTAAGGGGGTLSIGVLMNDSAATPTGGGTATLTNVDINASGGTSFNVGLRLDDSTSVTFKEGTASALDSGGVGIELISGSEAIIDIINSQIAGFNESIGHNDEIVNVVLSQLEPALSLSPSHQITQTFCYDGTFIPLPDFEPMPFGG